MACSSISKVIAARIILAAFSPAASAMRPFRASSVGSLAVNHLHLYPDPFPFRTLAARLHDQETGMGVFLKIDKSSILAQPHEYGLFIGHPG